MAHARVRGMAHFTIVNARPAIGFHGVAPRVPQVSRPRRLRPPVVEVPVRYENLVAVLHSAVAVSLRRLGRTIHERIDLQLLLHQRRPMRGVYCAGDQTLSDMPMQQQLQQ